MYMVNIPRCAVLPRAVCDIKFGDLKIRSLVNSLVPACHRVFWRVAVKMDYITTAFTDKRINA